ncbi:MAG: flippase [Bacteroidaceae bacterium]|nr:flippase [Bacteroidaceae bacterium]
MSSIKKNFLYSSILTTANYLFPLLTYPYVSRVLGVTNIGICNFVDSIIHYFILVSMMGINIVGIREVAKSKSNQTQLNQTFSGLFWLNTITTSIALVILVIVTMTVEQLRGHWQLMAIGAMKLVMNYMLIEWLYKGLEEFKYITIRTLAVKVMYVVAVFVFVRNAEDYPIYYLLSVLMIVLNAVINIVYSRHYVSLKMRNVAIMQLMKPFAILGVYQLLTSMYTSFNVAYLGFVAGETEVGYYTTASKLYNILIALFTALTGVMLPRMSSLLSEGKVDEFKAWVDKSNNVLFTFSIPVIVFMIIYAPTIIYIISGVGYEGAVTPMQIMMPLILIIGYEQILIVQTLMPLKKDNAILINSLAGAFAGLVLNVLLVSNLKSVGSSIVWLVSEITVLGCAQHFVSKFIDMAFPLWKMIRLVLINIPMGIGLYLISVIVENRWIALISASCFLILYTALYNIQFCKKLFCKQSSVIDKL